MATIMAVIWTRLSCPVSLNLLQWNGKQIPQKTNNISARIQKPVCNTPQVYVIPEIGTAIIIICDYVRRSQMRITKNIDGSQSCHYSQHYSYTIHRLIQYLPLMVQKGVSLKQLSIKSLELQNKLSLLNTPISRIRSVFVWLVQCTKSLTILPTYIQKPR